MAGSLNHIVGEKGELTLGMCENMRDCYEALDECYHIIGYLVRKDPEQLPKALQKLGYPISNEISEAAIRARLDAVRARKLADDNFKKEQDK
jgi:hypothetical protein